MEITFGQSNRRDQIYVQNDPIIAGIVSFHLQLIPRWSWELSLNLSCPEYDLMGFCLKNQIWTLDFMILSFCLRFTPEMIWKNLEVNSLPSQILFLRIQRARATGNDTDLDPRFPEKKSRWGWKTVFGDVSLTTFLSRCFTGFIFGVLISRIWNQPWTFRTFLSQHGYNAYTVYK